MDLVGIGKRVRIYLDESDQWQHRPLYLAVVDLLRSEGCAGATVVRGVAGFGAHRRIHTATLVDVTPDLPLIVEWIDTPERVVRVLPKVRAMVRSGMITSEDVEIVFYQSRPVNHLSNELPAGDVMTAPVVAVRPETPLREAVNLLIGKDYRALPVVDQANHVVGIVTNEDLVERGGLRARVELLGALSAQHLAQELARIEDSKLVGEVMTHPVVTIQPTAKLADVAHLMLARTLQRIPVVDEDGRLVGMVSRADLLRTRSDGYLRPAQPEPPSVGRTIGEVMRTDAPVVRVAAPLSEVLDTVASSRLNGAIVVASDGHVVGVVTDAEILRRLSPEDHPSIVRVLMSRLPLVHLSPAEQSQLEHALAKSAAELMVPNVRTVTADTPLGDAIEIMLKQHLELLPVVDAAGRLVGAADREDLLRTLVILDQQRLGEHRSP
jgi:CBS domain-containing protein